MSKKLEKDTINKAIALLIAGGADLSTLFANLPGKVGDRGRTGKDNRLFVNGCLWIIRSYKARNLIERAFNKLKHWRRVATRYDRCDPMFISSISLASIAIWT